VKPLTARRLFLFALTMAVLGTMVSMCGLVFCFVLGKWGPYLFWIPLGGGIAAAVGVGILLCFMEVNDRGQGNPW
jgi:hypothetical protein